MVVVRNSEAWIEASLIMYSGASGAKGFVDVIPPAVGDASTTSTSSPALARYAAATSPLCPDPTTTTSASRGGGASFMTSPSVVGERAPPAQMHNLNYIKLSYNSGQRTTPVCNCGVGEIQRLKVDVWDTPSSRLHGRKSLSRNVAMVLIAQPRGRGLAHRAACSVQSHRQ